MACVHNQDQMLAFEYGLLSDERSKTIKDNLIECPSCQEAQEQAKQRQRQFASWPDENPPSSLLQNTLSRIRQFQKNRTANETHAPSIPDSNTRARTSA